ncbi:MAG: hypothetical protein AUK28_04070 [Desulfobacterales bacterium CG2_30_60_27]|nr:MAG: hypothetical protein AUK28_04070 [Desulfobacterales bacterium CG2_30_60_27]
MRNKIKILGKPPAAVTPADGCSSLKNKLGAFRACIELLEKDKLEKLGAVDMTFSIRFHLFRL